MLGDDSRAQASLIIEENVLIGPEFTHRIYTKKRTGIQQT